MVRRVPATPGMTVVTIPRSTFLTEYWDYKAGDHVSFIGPTGSGKTFLANPLLAASVSEELPGFILVMKRRDKTVTLVLDSSETKSVVLDETYRVLLNPVIRLEDEDSPTVLL